MKNLRSRSAVRLQSASLPAGEVLARRAGRAVQVALLAISLGLPLAASADHHGGTPGGAHGASHKAAPHASDIEVSGGYTFASRPGVPNVGVYFEHVSNSGAEADELLSAETSLARRTELHEMKVENEVMRMRQLPSITIPAHGSVDMRKGASYHVMVMGIDKPVVAGDRFDLKLRFRRAGEMTVPVEVREAGKAAGHGHGASAGHGGHAAGHSGKSGH